MELAELQCDTILKQKYADEGIPKFYSFLSQKRFPGLYSVNARIIALFGGTYVCEQFFSSLKFNKSALRSRVTDEHLQATLRLISSDKFNPTLRTLLMQNAAS